MIFPSFSVFFVRLSIKWLLIEFNKSTAYLV